MPPLTGRVVDNANLLSVRTEAALTTKLAALEGRRTDQLVVVTLPSLHGNTIERVGLRLGRGWGIGQVDKNNGVLLIIAPNERKVRIEVGTGLESAIEDHEAARMIETIMLPSFHAGALESGIVAGADAIIAELDRSPLAEANR
nr:TPM domain-containing protein [Sphingomonas arenae]